MCVEGVKEEIKERDLKSAPLPDGIRMGDIVSQEYNSVVLAISSTSSSFQVKSQKPQKPDAVSYFRKQRMGWVTSTIGAFLQHLVIFY
ncbi:hypothetical protein CHS0354_007082, partial [Potamilus streckersoni]